jgi:hypothetical protein
MKTSKLNFMIITAIASIGLNSARADQPHLRRALERLRAARAELQSAEYNKGGWRARAVANVDKAIADAEKGMAVAR